MTTARELAQREPERWRAATRHAFLDGARDGTLPASTFDRWLEQDTLFVRALVRAWSTLLARAPVEDFALLSDGIAAFVGELEWFAEVAATRGLLVDVEPLPATAAYEAHLFSVAHGPHAAALSAMWAVEAAYLEAWRSALPGAPGYRAFVEHWTSPAFAAFVERVEAAVDRALAVASVDEVQAAADLVALTADHEAAFWEMTWASSPTSDPPH